MSLFRKALGIYVRGFAMGAADVVPGVSGGTIAFITGIYERLIQCLTSVDVRSVQLLFRWRIRELWARIDGNFLLLLLAGILSAIFSLAHVIDFLLDQYPILVWSAFFGLIVASALTLLIKNIQISLQALIFLVLGMILIFLVSTSSYTALDPVLPVVFLAGMIAISAMLLPGLSGSFLLLVFGLYEPTLEAVKALDFAYLLSFAMGAATGLLLFSRLIHWLLKHHYRNTLMLLIGMLFGSLYAVWPWRSLDTVNVPLLPSSLSDLGRDPMLLQALACMLSAAAVVLLFETITGQFARENNQENNKQND